MYIWGVYNIHIQLWFTYNTIIQSFITSFGESFRDIWLDIQCTYVQLGCVQIYTCVHNIHVQIWLMYNTRRLKGYDVILIAKNTPSTIKLYIVHVLC